MSNIRLQRLTDSVLLDNYILFSTRLGSTSKTIEPEIPAQSEWR